MGSVARAWGVCQRTRENDTTVRRESMLRDTQATWLPNAGVQVWCVAPRGGDEADTRRLEKRK